MDDVTDHDLILAAFELGANFGRKSVVGGFLQTHGLRLTTEMVQTMRDQIYMFSGVEPFEQITELKVPSEIHDKMLAGRPRILIIAQLAMYTKEELVEIYKLTSEEADQVEEAFKFATWRLLPSIKPSN